MISFRCCTVPSSSSPRLNFKFNFKPPLLLPHLLNPKLPVSSLPSPLRATKRNFLFLLLSLPLSPFPALSESTDGDTFDPVTALERQASADVSRRVDKAVELLDLARDLQAKGDFPQALLFFTQLIRDYKDFALTEYARVGRALVLYEIGDRDEAIAEMEDVSISLKGYPEIHAALAAALYADKRAPLLAENQFTIATLLDPHYTDISYVRETKHWPPSLVSSLQHFITLS
ncbi:TPR repeat protein [Rhynchospora pubera]|uniref:TPR repeat protein n=1 Tax=Rhynchospora pubera TaxID=906938 RepID=A0AAV8HTJ6_9POAL|nr:TPR repeat protein [Rhynchospora pubera]